ncbi:MAG TPA: T9SS type A sorting domain-containing protein, partial [Bacteroidia bacterium]|nr:T9SS type A sorting domain-containing protein [Bacteroidia bacterium]
IVFTHTTNDPTSGFQMPVYIDSINPSMTLLMGHPRIACNNDGTDNDSANISTVVVADRYWNSVDYDVLGLYSLASVYSTMSHWHTSAVASSGNYETEGDIAFNDSDHFFYATYFDSTTSYLAAARTDYNNITGWTVQNLQYNDQTNNVVQPYPRLSINPVSATPNYVWNSQNSNGKGIALFDAQNNPTGIPLAENVYDFLSPSPNPSSGIVNFKYTLKSDEYVQLSVINILGQEIIPTTGSGIQSAGMHNLPVDFSDLPNGIYVYRFVAGREIKTGNLVIAH